MPHLAEESFYIDTAVKLLRIHYALINWADINQTRIAETVNK